MRIGENSNHGLPVSLHPQTDFHSLANFQSRFNAFGNRLVWFNWKLRINPKKPRLNHGLNRLVWFCSSLVVVHSSAESTARAGWTNISVKLCCGDRSWPSPFLIDHLSFVVLTFQCVPEKRFLNLSKIWAKNRDTLADLRGRIIEGSSLISITKTGVISSETYRDGPH